MSEPGHVTGPPVATDAGSSGDLPTVGGLQSQAVRGTWWSAVNAIAGIPLAFGVNLVVARVLGADGYGRLASYLTAYTVLLLVLNAGTSDGVIQWGAAAYARGDRTQFLALCRRAAGFHVLVELPLGVFATVLLLWHEAVVTQVIAGLSVGVALLVATPTVALTAMSRNASLAKISLVVGLAVQLAVLVAAIETRQAGPTLAARLLVVVAIPLVAVSLTPSDVRRACVMIVLPRHWPKGFAGYAIRNFAAALVSTLVFSRSELLVLDARGDVVAAGVFALAAGLATHVTAPVDAALGPLIPAAASLVEVDRTRAAAAVLRGIRVSACAAAILAVFAVPAVAVLVVSLYGSGFEASSGLFVALGLTSCLQSSLHPAWAFLGALRRPLLILATNAVAFAADVTLVLTLVPALGAVAAVIGSSVAQVISLSLTVRILTVQLSLQPREVRRALLPFLLLCVTSAAAAVGGMMLGEHASILVVLPATVVMSGLAGCALLRFVGGMLTASDLRALGAAFPDRAGPFISLAGHLGLIRRDA